jgi:hypothetical protein
MYDFECELQGRRRPTDKTGTRLGLWGKLVESVTRDRSGQILAVCFVAATTLGAMGCSHSADVTVANVEHDERQIVSLNCAAAETDLKIIDAAAQAIRDEVSKNAFVHVWAELLNLQAPLFGADHTLVSMFIANTIGDDDELATQLSGVAKENVTLTDCFDGNSGVSANVVHQGCIFHKATVLPTSLPEGRYVILDLAVSLPVLSSDGKRAAVVMAVGAIGTMRASYAVATMSYQSDCKCWRVSRLKVVGIDELRNDALR